METTARTPAYREDMIDADGTLADRVYRHLADRLIAGRFAPGDRFSLRAVADALGISMMPVREAVLRLSAENALEVTPKRAVCVPFVTSTYFRDITRVRVEIEGFAAALAASNATPAALAEIRAKEVAFRHMSREAAPDLARAVADNQAFHFAIYRAAGSPELLAIIERLWLRVGPIINLDLRENPERLSLGDAVRFHASALAAIEAGDAAGARSAISGDIGNAASFILSRGQLPA
jgi:DNA-binding GntR family transcriptional regulator